MLRRNVILIFMLVMPGVLLAANSPQENNWLDKIGQALAGWSTEHQTMIRINGKPIALTNGTLYVMRVEQTPDGPRRVCRGRVIISWPDDREADEKSRAIRDNLQGLMEKSRCDWQALSAYIDRLNETGGLSQQSAEDLAQGMKCLGNLEFTPVEK